MGSSDADLKLIKQIQPVVTGIGTAIGNPHDYLLGRHPVGMLSVAYAIMRRITSDRLTRPVAAVKPSTAARSSSVAICSSVSSTAI